MNALQKRNEDVKYARTLGIVKPHTLKGPALAEAIAEAEALLNARKIADETDEELLNNPEDDPFDDIDPSVEGDHLEDTPEERVAAAEATREAWLLAAVDELRPILKQAGAPVPDKLHVSVGWPSRSPRKIHGQCFVAVEGGINHLFITPVLGDAVEVLACLTHELIHAADNCESGHAGFFRSVHQSVGFVGKATGYVAGDELRATLTDVAKTLGEYPHIPLLLAEKESQKKQTTRLMKVWCPECKETPIRMTTKHKDSLPFCGGGCTEIREIESDSGEVFFNMPVRMVFADAD